MYGEWLRGEIEAGNVKLWEEKEMSDLAILLSQLLSSHKVLFGASPKELFDEVPKKDILKAMKDSSDERFEALSGDTRNVLLMQDRIWVYLELGEIDSKPEAADWALHKLPKEHQESLQKANYICLGEREDLWEGDLNEAIEYAKFMKKKIEEHF